MYRIGSQIVNPEALAHVITEIRRECGTVGDGENDGVARGNVARVDD